MFEYILVFCFMFLADVIWTYYFIYIEKRYPIRAATTGTLIYLLSSFVTIKWMENQSYLIPACLGAFLGTWYTVRKESNGR